MIRGLGNSVTPLKYGTNSLLWAYIYIQNKQVNVSVHRNSLACKPGHTSPGLDIEKRPLRQTETDVWELHNSRGLAAVLGSRTNAR